MVRRYTAEDLIDFLIMVKGGDAGRGLSEGPQTGLLEAIAEDRASGSIRARLESVGDGRSFTQRSLRVAAKPKRKVSAYQKEFGRQLKRLKKKHPRTPVTRLMKRAHTATKKARRGK